MEEPKILDSEFKFPEFGYCSNLKRIREFFKENEFELIKPIERQKEIDTDIDWRSFEYIAWSIGRKKLIFFVKAEDLVNYSRASYLNVKVSEIDKYINYKKEKDEKQRNTENKVQGIASKDRQPARTGAIAIRHRGQQIAIGIRPSSNSTRSSVTTSRIRKAEVRKNIVKRSNH